MSVPRQYRFTNIKEYDGYNYKYLANLFHDIDINFIQDKLFKEEDNNSCPRGQRQAIPSLRLLYIRATNHLVTKNKKKQKVQY